MKAGDLVKIRHRDGSHHHMHSAGPWAGKIGTIVDVAKRVHSLAFKVLIDGEVIEFDWEEVEIVND